MTGTVIITGANGSAALGFVSEILSAYPSHTLLATVRNPSTSDPNTAKLSKLIASHKTSRAHIQALDLSVLSNVRTFAEETAKRVADGEIPRIKAIVCNAFTSSLTEQCFTSDGFERTFHVNHLAHYLLVLKLLGSMASDGRIVMLGSNAHYTDRPHPLYNLRAKIPDDVELLIKPHADKPGEEHDRGFQRYGNTKLANVMFMHDLNSKLEKTPGLSGMTAITMDPAGMVDSRATSVQKLHIRILFGIVSLLLPLLKHVTSSVRPSVEAGRDLAEISVGDSFKGRSGYFVGLRRDEETAASKDVEKRDALWRACWEWAGLKKEDTVLAGAAP
ncbi:hypothetical protein FSARC_8937 [Fusarium sarcochroum]|uniref:3beta-hydroxysteroid 3-dehydrogenase n=1 Tax=Fusarium sarcochroum TaxID=1208366 RepID=A0A8H4TS95_9HYPO|nr:hypothetical protein FSARC_8937 [Fusarium sarcochroum]